MKYRIMCQTDVDYLARKERARDLLREAERERLVQTTRSEQAALLSRLGTWLAQLATRRPRRSQSVMPFK